MLRSYSQHGYRRTNSLNSKGFPLTNAERNTLGGEKNKLEGGYSDCSTIMVFSREAKSNFSPAWHKSYPNLLPEYSQDNIEVKNKLSLRPEVEGNTLEEQINKSLISNEIPHVVAVIEGRHAVDEFNVEHNSKNIKYKQKLFVEGKNINGQTDHKQSMTFYVREDLYKSYNFTPTTVKGKINQNIKLLPKKTLATAGKTKTSAKKTYSTFGKKVIPPSKVKTAITKLLDVDIKCVSVDYQTREGATIQNYQSLVVHIPNKYTENQQTCQSVHECFKNYANEKQKKDGTIVTSYFGDTNFKKIISQHSIASVGGMLSNGDTVKRRSSGAIEPSYFMQAISLIEDSDHQALQPSTTNPLKINNKGMKDSYGKEFTEAVDHYSFLHRVLHKGSILGRKAIGHYYT